jgi:hypothetical protein
MIYFIGIRRLYQIGIRELLLNGIRLESERLFPALLHNSCYATSRFVTLAVRPFQIMAPDS